MQQMLTSIFRSEIIRIQTKYFGSQKWQFYQHQLCNNIKLICISFSMNQKERCHSFETFRGDEKVQRIKTHILDTTLNETNLDNSHIVNVSPGSHYRAKSLIRCPSHNPDEIYKCQICTRLRLACPYRSRSKDLKNVKIRNQKGIQVVNQNRSKIQRSETTLNLSTDKPKFFVDNPDNNIKFKTPQFTGNFKDLGVKFADSLPYIKTSIDGTDRSANATFQKASNEGYNIFINNKKMPTSIPNSISNSHVHFNNVHNIGTTTPLRIIRNETIPITYRQFQEQIIYVPIIRNVIIPQVVFNPEVSRVKNSSYGYKMQDSSNKKSNEPPFSPARSRATDFYNEKGIITPENFKKLAQSLIRQ